MTLNPDLLNRSAVADAVNEAGGLAYRLGPRHALAQMAATGCLSNTYYADADAQIDAVVGLVEQVDAPFLARLAVYARQRALMKDMPAALLLALSRRDRALFARVFPRVIDNGRMLRTFFSLLRGGRLGRKSLSHALQKAVQDWLNGASVGTLLGASVGNAPSLRDVLRLARPTPRDDARRALFGWLTDAAVEKWAPATADDLPGEVRDLLAYRRAESAAEQVALLGRNRFRWDLLADAARGPEVWKAVARQMGPQALRMNLNTLRRHGVFDDAGTVAYVAGRIADAEEVRRSRQFPYQFFAAYLNADEGLPAALRDALEAAAEAACANVPALPGPVVVGLDVSGSMGSAISGTRGRTQASKVRCVDAAAVFAAAVLRRNPRSVVIPFDTSAHVADVSPDEGILALARRLSAYGGGGTDCSLPLSEAAGGRFRDRRFAGCVLLSDNESWVGEGRAGSTAVLTWWQRFVANQARLGASPDDVKLVCIDVQPNATTQAPEREDVMNVGGFSDAVFTVVEGFMSGEAAGFVAAVEAVEL